MHATQLVSDVFEHICEWTDPASLSVMARTAGVLHEPAIHALWRSLPSLIPLLQCFPTDSWTIEGDTFKFTRILRPRDWTAALKYASLVRHFDEEKEPLRSRPADAAVWESMCCLRPTITLFPQLRTLHWEVIQLPDKCIPSFLVCVGPNPFRMVFESLEHRSGYTTDEFRSSLDIIAERFPGLRELYVGYCRGGGDRTSEPVLLFPTLPPSFPSLVSFVSRICPITPAALLGLVRLKTLRSVTVRLQDDAEWPPAPTTHISLDLQNVELISSLRTCIAFCKTTTLPHATALSLKLTGVPPSHLIPNLVHAIRRQCSPDVLENVSIYEVDTTDDAREDLIFPTYLRPLLDFKKLESLSVELQCEYALDDEFCADMAKNWPRIKVLEVVNWDTECVHDVFPTARVLPLFAMHCPKLKRLGLAFDARRWKNQADFGADSLNAEIYGALADRASTSVLSVLYVGTSPIFVPEYVAAFLDRVFPNLVSICPGLGGGMETQWEAVERFLGLFKHVRKNERRRICQGAIRDGRRGTSGIGEMTVPQ